MPDTLRTRIASVVYDAVAWRSVDVPVAQEVADAVIRELDDMGIIHLSKVKHDGAFKYGEHYGI